VLYAEATVQRWVIERKAKYAASANLVDERGPGGLWKKVGEVVYRTIEAL
jgi:hypothetical protein